MFFAIAKSNAVKIIGNTNIFGALLALVIAILVQLPMINLVEYSVKAKWPELRAKGNPVDISTLRWMQRMTGKPGNDALDLMYSNGSLELPLRTELYRRVRDYQYSNATRAKRKEMAKEKLAPLYESGQFNIISSGVELNVADKEALEIFLVGEPMFNFECLESKHDCRAYLVTGLDKDNEFVLIVARMARDALQISWRYKTPNDGLD